MISQDFDSISNAAQWVSAYRTGDERVSAFYRGEYGETPLRENGLTAEEIVEWRDFLSPYAREPALLEPLDKLLKPGAMTVVTGQQAGAGLGPLMTLYKALGAVQRARQLESQSGRPVLPVFWVASDDHDLAEADSLAWFNEQNEVERVTLSPDRAVANRAVWRCPVDREKAGQALEKIHATTIDSEFQQQIITDLQAAWLNDEATFESQFLTLFMRWVAPLGILPIAPRVHFLRKRGADLFQREIQGARTNELAEQAARQIEALGMSAPLHRKAHDLNFFLDVGEIRGKMSRDGDQLVIRDPVTKDVLHKFSEAELLAVLQREPERFSPNAILRPLVQDYALPNAAYVAGPTELLYHGQIGAIYEEFWVQRPAVLARPNVTLLEKKAQRAGEKLSLYWDQIPLAAEADFVEALRSDTSKDQRFQETERQLTEILSLAGELQQLIKKHWEKIPAVTKAVDKLRQGMENGSEKLLERVQAQVASEDEQRKAAAEKLHKILFPEKSPQERTVSAISFLIHHGPQLAEKLLSELDCDSSEFQPVRL